MDDVTILHGDALTMLRTLPTGSVHCVVTSPPYYGLRDYGTATWIGGDPACEHRPGSQSRVGKTTLQGATATTGHQHEGYRLTCGKCGALRQDDQIGLEPTVDAYVARLVEVFEEVRRVLRADGTLWLNIGDSYASGKGTCFNPGGGPKSYIQEKERFPLDRGSVATLRESGLKSKDLIGIPWRVALALQAAGWWLRSDIIWAKRAPMPESVTDRPTRSHEHVFLLTKRERYYYDQEAVREPQVKGAAGSTFTEGKTGHNGNGRQSEAERQDNPAGRNQRDVWTLGPEPYPDAHFATFPTEIPRRAILAGTSERGCCPCGAPWARIIENSGTGPQRQSRKNEQVRLTRFAGQAWERWKAENPNVTTGWAPTCTCPPADPIPCTVLDPFGGSGTTAAVAVGLGRRAILVELNAAYIELQRARIEKVQRPLLSAVAS